MSCPSPTQHASHCPLYRQVEAEGDVATAFTLARILSDIPLSRGGPTSVVIFDIHALQERFYFGDTVLPLFESGIPLLRARLESLPDADNVTIAYPDEGAWKRFHYQFGDYPEVVQDCDQCCNECCCCKQCFLCILPYHHQRTPKSSIHRIDSRTHARTHSHR